MRNIDQLDWCKLLDVELTSDRIHLCLRIDNILADLLDRCENCINFLNKLQIHSKKSIRAHHMKHIYDV